MVVAVGLDSGIVEFSVGIPDMLGRATENDVLFEDLFQIALILEKFEEKTLIKILANQRRDGNSISKSS